VANIDDTYQETARIMLTRTTDEWLQMFSKTSVPTNMVNTLQGLRDDPHLNAVGFWQEVDHPTEGRLRMTRYPVTFSETPASVRRLQPRLGEHTVEVLRENGISDERIDALLASGAAVRAV
jgi:crotonobetainyl-CoA:carnitine CoA-transferase CaiB-like acyl-CoA transferase